MAVVLSAVVVGAAASSEQEIKPIINEKISQLKERKKDTRGPNNVIIIWAHLLVGLGGQEEVGGSIDCGGC